MIVLDESQPTEHTLGSEASLKHRRLTQPIWASQDNAPGVIAEEQAAVI